MADNTLNRLIRVQGDASQAHSELNRLDNDLTRATQSTKKLDKATDDLGKTNDSTAKRVTENGGAVGLLDEITGGLVTTFKDAGEAIELAGGSLNSFAGIAAAAGIGALVLAVGYLAENWDKVKNAITGVNEADLETQKNLRESNAETRALNTELNDLYTSYIKFNNLSTIEGINKANSALSLLSKTLGEFSDKEFKLGDTTNNRQILSDLDKSIEGYLKYNAALSRSEVLKKANVDLEKELAEAQKDIDEQVISNGNFANARDLENLQKIKNRLADNKREISSNNEELAKGFGEYDRQTNRR